MAKAWRADQFENSVNRDCTVKVGDKEWTLDKAVLSNGSRYFYGLFRSGLQEAQTGVVVIEGFDSDVMGKVLKYIYTRDANDIAEKDDKDSTEALNIKTYVQAWMIADYLEIPECQDEMAKRVTDLCSFYTNMPHFAAMAWYKNVVQSLVEGIEAAFRDTKGSGEGLHEALVRMAWSVFPCLDRTSTWNELLEAVPLFSTAFLQSIMVETPDALITRNGVCDSCGDTVSNHKLLWKYDRVILDMSWGWEHDPGNIPKRKSHRKFYCSSCAYVEADVERINSQ